MATWAQEWAGSADPAQMLRMAALLRSPCCGCLWRDAGDGTLSLAGGMSACRHCDNGPDASYEPVVSLRRQRLWMAACCRHVWDELTEPDCRRAVVTAELYADGLADEGSLHKACAAVWSLYRARRWEECKPAYLAWAACSRNLVGPLRHERYVLAPLAYNPHMMPVPAQTQCDLLREVCGNPFAPRGFPGTTVRPAWADDLLVLGMARDAYERRDFRCLPVLADAAEEAGCQDGDILEHLRRRHFVRYAFAGAVGSWGGYHTLEEAVQAEGRCREHWGAAADVRIDAPGHARGCWAVDLVLGKG